MAECNDTYEIDVEDLTEALMTNIKDDMKTFDDFLNLNSALNREILIGEIVDGLGVSVESYIRYWNKQDEGIPREDRKPIKIYIDSLGGMLTDSMTIIDAIKMSKTPVIGICTGCAYSGGFFIFISCGKRIAYPHSSYLFHEGATSTGGTSGQFQNYAAFYKKQLDQLKDIVLNNTNITEDEYRDIKKDDIWYDAKEALEKGIADVIAEDFV
jgi:ATP-dependent Clp protease protease subunit